jgi:hypothetical protein
MQRRYGAIALAAAVLALAACSSSSSTSSKTAASPTATTMTGTETVAAALTGSAAASNLNSNSSAPLTFPAGVWTGPVTVTVKPFKLPGSGGNSNAAATSTLDTPDGNVTVHHGANQVPGASNPNVTPPTVWTKNGTQCYFVATFSKGTVVQVAGSTNTGKFAGAVPGPGTGAYLVTASGYVPLKSGKTACSFNNTGNVESSGAAIKFTASFPITIKT